MKFNLHINGRDYFLETEPNRTLLDVLRSDLGLTGTKYGCGVGRCGTCTIIIDGKAKCSCLMLVGQAEGKRIETIEGLGEGEKLHPLQESFIQNHGLQCGYCTPGMLMSAKALLDGNPSLSEEEIRTAIAGNLCRCTGYVQIIRSIKEAAERSTKNRDA
jgi:carbon-monoxide dehydrogenase small subunit